MWIISETFLDNHLEKRYNVHVSDLITNYDRKSNDGDSSAARKAGARQGRWEPAVSKVDVKITAIDMENQKVSLSIRALLEEAPAEEEPEQE